MERREEERRNFRDYNYALLTKSGRVRTGDFKDELRLKGS